MQSPSAQSNSLSVLYGPPFRRQRLAAGTGDPSSSATVSSGILGRHQVPTAPNVRRSAALMSSPFLFTLLLQLWAPWVAKDKGGRSTCMYSTTGILSMFVNEPQCPTMQGSHTRCMRLDRLVLSHKRRHEKFNRI
jgi:hypothetical protein